MSILKNLFGINKEKRLQTKENAGNDNFMPTRSLNLIFSPIPENGKKFATEFANAVLNNEQIVLDYSMDSLNFVDNFLETYGKELKVNDFAETIFIAGCYVGQVFVENAGGKWISGEEAKKRHGIYLMNIVVELPNGKIVNPIAKAFKRFHNGNVDNIVYFYQTFTSDN